jgi:cation-transporting ATPase E
MSDTATIGLSEAEVVTRRNRGEGNDIDQKSSRSYGDIIRHNVFATFNIFLSGSGVILYHNEAIQ